jgi:transposase
MFCERYREWLGRRGLVMRQVHVAGDKGFFDYSGKKARIVDPATGEVTDVELFVAALGASNFTYAEATYTQRGPDRIASHVRCFEYFGGVPSALVPDPLKSGVTRACLYEPGVQRTYEELAQHYGTTVLPARPAHPRDKAKVEVAVQSAQRWLLARIRDEVFHSLGALNARLRELLVDLNGRVMRRYGKSRRALFEEIERGALRPLPSGRFEYAEWRKARVNIDYHVAVDGHLYPVPYRLVHEEVEVRLTADVVEILQGRTRVAAHRRSSVKGGFATMTEHMPSAHRAHAEWTPSRILTWAGKVGTSTCALCDAILSERPHPEQGFRSCLGILRLGKRYGEGRLEAACARALAGASALVPACRIDPQERTRSRRRIRRSSAPSLMRSTSRLRPVNAAWSISPYSFASRVGCAETQRVQSP